MVIAANLITDQLQGKLIEAIIFGDLPAEARLVEDAIAEQYGISRSPVREALRRIEADGLLTREGAKGLNVAPMSQRDLNQVYVCRLPLEGIAAAEAATTRSPADIVRLNEIYDRMVAAQQNHEVREYFLSNVAFTDAVHLASGNNTLCRLLGGLNKQSQRYRFAAYQMFPHLIAFSVDGSRRIIEAVAEQSADTARTVTEELIKRSWLTLRDCFA
jgi:DNA-binding GntR family transcriptional regulator